MALNYVLIKGAGDLASGVAWVLKKAGFRVVMTEISQPTCVRRKVSFAEAVYEGEVWVAGIRGSLVNDFSDAMRIVEQGEIPVIIDPQGNTIKDFPPEIFIDGSMTKKNFGTCLSSAETVIALGPGFEAGKDADAVIETQRGPNLGKPIFSGYAEPNTGIPGDVLGFTSQRLLRAPDGGVFREKKKIGDFVDKGDIVAFVNEAPVRAEIAGTVRGLLKTGLTVYPGMKVGDIHPEKNQGISQLVTDKAWTIGIGVLRAISFLHRKSESKKRAENLTAFSRLRELLHQGKSGIMYTVVDTGGAAELELGSHLLVVPGGEVYGSLGIPVLDQDLIARSNQGIPGQSGTKILEWEVPWILGTESMPQKRIKILEDVISPQKKLIIFGGGHISLPLAEMAAILGFRVIVVDDREEFANRERFPRADQVVCAEFGEVFREKLLAGEIDCTTSIVIVTRGHSQDKTCVQNLVHSDAGYIGMIGSSSKVKQTFQALLEEGLSRDDLTRISAPIGLDLGGQTPAEIALSILAEIVARENRGTGRPVKELKGVMMS